jgi:hypothetical protein
VVFDTTLESNFAEIEDELRTNGVQLLRWQDRYQEPTPRHVLAEMIDEEVIARQSTDAVDPSLRNVSFVDIAALIYTRYAAETRTVSFLGLGRYIVAQRGCQRPRFAPTVE